MQNPKKIPPFTRDRAGKAGGAYLESIGKYDLTKLTKEEWDTFVETICAEFDWLPF